MTNKNAKANFPEFALFVQNILFEKYLKTYFVGGAVRDLLLQRKFTDVDITTSATPEQVIKLLNFYKIKHSVEHQKFGVIIAQKEDSNIEISTFRTEIYDQSRYPKVAYISSPSGDSRRRDFTINGIYYNPQTGEFLDFYQGLNDLKNRQLRLIGVASKKLTEDPLRIIRGYRFQLQLNFSLEQKTANAMQKYLPLVKKVSKARLQKEINALQTKKLRDTLQKVIHSIA